MQKARYYSLAMVLVYGAYICVLLVAARPLPRAPLLKNIGAGLDAHGCRPSAGYSFCLKKNRCIRPFEEKCDEQHNIKGPREPRHDRRKAVISAEQFRAIDPSTIEVSNNGIPLVLHQTWKSMEVPEVHRPYVESWTRCISGTGWIHVLWTDNEAHNLVAEAFPDFLPTYEGFAHEIQRVDTFRYALLAKYGGVYADMDNECRTLPDFSTFPNCKVLLSQQPLKSIKGYFATTAYKEMGAKYGVDMDFTAKSDRWAVQNSFMASAPNNKFWNHLIGLAMARADAAKESNFVSSWLKPFGATVAQSSGVSLNTEAYFSWRFDMGNTEVCPLPRTEWNGEDQDTQDSKYVVHHGTAVWRRETVGDNVWSKTTLFPIIFWIIVLYKHRLDLRPKGLSNSGALQIIISKASLFCLIFFAIIRWLWVGMCYFTYYYVLPMNKKMDAIYEPLMLISLALLSWRLMPMLTENLLKLV